MAVATVAFLVPTAPPNAWLDDLKRLKVTYVLVDAGASSGFAQGGFKAQSAH